MATGLSIHVLGDKALARKLNRAKRAMIEKDLMEGAVQIASGEVKRTTTGGNPLHVRTQRLRSSWIPGRARNIREVRSKRALLGSAVKYAAIHEFGGKAGRNRKVRIPARRYVTLALQATKPKVEKFTKQTMDKALETP